MITVLAIAVVVLALVSALNFALLVRVMRRPTGEPHAEMTPPLLPVHGSAISEFEPRAATSGRVIDPATLRGGVVHVAFMSSTCSACATAAARIRHSASEPWVIFFESGRGDGAILEVSDLEPLGDVVTIASSSDIPLAFGGIEVTPTLLRLEDGRVAAASYRVEDVEGNAPAPAVPGS